MSHYGNNVLPLEYSTGDISNTYFKTFYYENENKSNVENNCDQNLYNLNSLQNYNNLNASHLNMNNPPMYGLSPELSIHNSEMYENNQNLEDMMYNLEQSSNNIDYKDVYSNLPDNVVLNSSTGTQSQTYRGEVISNTEGKTAVEILQEQRAQQDQNAVNQITSTDDKWCLDSNNLNKECSLMPFSDCEDLGYETYNTESNCESARSQEQQTAIKYIWFTGKSPHIQLHEVECYVNGVNIFEQQSNSKAYFTTDDFNERSSVGHNNSLHPDNAIDQKLDNLAHNWRGNQEYKNHKNLLIEIDQIFKFSNLQRIVVHKRKAEAQKNLWNGVDYVKLLDSSGNVIKEYDQSLEEFDDVDYVNYIGEDDNNLSNENKLMGDNVKIYILTNLIQY